MDVLTQFIGAPANALTLLIVGGVLFFQLIDRGYLKIGKTDSFSAKIDKLAQYANHDTTERLDRLIAMEEKEHEAAQITRDTLLRISLTLESLERSGVKCRKE